MAWTIEYSNRAEAQLQRLDRQTSERIAAYMRERVAASDNPREQGKALHGPLAGLWSYRVGNYRVVCDIQDNVLRILVVRVGRRGQVYR